MKIVETFKTLLRIVVGILVGFAGCLALLNAPYQLLNANFRVTDGGPIVLVSVIFGALMIWGAQRLIRGPLLRLPTA